MPGFDRRNRSGSEVRADAVALAREAADQRFRDGDPEGADVIRDLAKAIGRIQLKDRF